MSERVHGVEMVGLKEPAVGLVDRLTQIERQNDRQSLILERAKQITDIINLIPSDDTPRRRTTLLPCSTKLPQPGVASCLLYLFWQTCLSGLAHKVLLSKEVGVPIEAIRKSLQNVLPVLLHPVISTCTQGATPLLSLERSHQCTTATVVHWLEVLYESLRTVCTTVKTFTNKTLSGFRAVWTTAEPHTFTSDLGGASTIPVFANPSSNLSPCSSSFRADPLYLVEQVRRPPPLPPIITPPDADTDRITNFLQILSISPRYATISPSSISRPVDRFQW